VLEAASLDATDQAVSRNAKILEDEFGAVDRAVAELLDLLANGESAALLGDEHGHALVTRLRLRVGLGQDGKATALHAVGDPGLGAVDDVIIAVASRDRANALQIRAATRFGESDAAAQLATGKARQESFLLFIGAVPLYACGHDEMGIEDADRSHPGLGNARDDLGVHGCGEAEATVLG
jgi:hypothetical protein